MRRDTAITPAMHAHPKIGPPAKRYDELRERARRAGQDAEVARVAVEAAVEADREKGAAAILAGKTPAAAKGVELAQRECEGKVRDADQLERAVVLAEAKLLEAVEESRADWIAGAEADVEAKLAEARDQLARFTAAHDELAGALSARAYANGFPDARLTQGALGKVPALRGRNGDPTNTGDVFGALHEQLSSVDPEPEPQHQQTRPLEPVPRAA